MENNEVMESMENNEVMENTTEDGSVKVIGLVLAGLAGAAAAGVTVCKKLKAKKENEKPKRKKKLMWVEVDEETDKPIEPDEETETK